MFLDALEQKLKYGKDLLPQFKKLFVGTLINTIKCHQVDFTSETEEHFYDIQLNVRGVKNVRESLKDFISIEELKGENQYQTDKFGKQDAIKFLRIK